MCRRKKKNYIKSAPEITAENILKREFKADEFGMKWLTDVTEVFNTRQLEAAIIKYIDYYNNHRYQKRLGCYDTNGIQAASSEKISIKMTPTVKSG